MRATGPTSAAIFAGGRSSRFGSPKINAKIDGSEFGFRIITALKAAGVSNLNLIGGERADAERWNVGYVADEFIDAGPVGALLSAMRVCITDKILILPCDVPFIDKETCLKLLVLDDEYDVNVAFTQSAQWLCSNWRVSLLEVIEKKFQNGEKSIHTLAESLKVKLTTVSDFALINVNETNDLTRTKIE